MELRNGLKVLTQKTNTETISVEVLIKTGSVNDKKPGVSHFLEHVIMSSNPKLLDIPGSIDACTTKEFTCFTLSVLKKDLKQCIDLLINALLTTIFNPEVIERERAIIKEEVASSEADLQDQFLTHFEKCFFGSSHPLSNSVLGNPGQISREDLYEYKSSYYTPDHIVVSVVGDIDEDTIVEALGPLGNYRRGEAPLIPLMNFYQLCPNRIPIKPVVGINRLHFQDHLNQLSDKVVMAVPIFGITDPRRYSLEVLCLILSNKLFESVRQANPLTYTINVNRQLFEIQGMLSIYFEATPGNLQAAFDTVKAACLNLPSLTEKEFQKTLSQAKFYLVKNLESNDAKAARLAEDGMYDISSDIANYLETLTLKDLQVLAQEIFARDWVVLTTSSTLC